MYVSWLKLLLKATFSLDTSPLDTTLAVSSTELWRRKLEKVLTWKRFERPALRTEDRRLLLPSKLPAVADRDSFSSELLGGRDGGG